MMIIIIIIIIMVISCLGCMMKTSGAKYARSLTCCRLVIIGRVLLTFKLGMHARGHKKSATVGGGGGGGAKIQKSIKNFLHLFAHTAHTRRRRREERERESEADFVLNALSSS